MTTVDRDSLAAAIEKLPKRSHAASIHDYRDGVFVECLDRAAVLATLAAPRAKSSLDRPETVALRRLEAARQRINGALPETPALDVERLARALDAPGVFEDPLDDAIGLARDIAREYAALDGELERLRRIEG